MAERELKRKPAAAPREEQVIEEAPQTAAQGEKLKAELDDVLEENAEEFVRNYVQKGGE
jgi:ubiquitin-like protein Pup